MIPKIHNEKSVVVFGETLFITDEFYTWLDNEKVIFVHIYMKSEENWMVGKDIKASELDTFFDDELALKSFIHVCKIALGIPSETIKDLSKRELKVLKYLAKNHSNEKIAEELFLSIHTVKSHIYQIFKKLNVKNRKQAMMIYHMQGLK